MRDRRAVKAVVGKEAEEEVPVEAMVSPESGDQKKKILWNLKVMGEAGLEDLAKKLKISRMAVHKHLAALQERGLVESDQTKGDGAGGEKKRAGRPRFVYRLTDESAALFPRAYGGIAICALRFVERKLGREGVEQVLRERQSGLLTKYQEGLRELDLDDRVKELAKLRDSEGYMAEAKRLPSGKYVMLEHNCPIIHVAQDYWEACSTERELFENLLGASVDTTHRVVKGDMVCRFLIDPKKSQGGALG
jgi:predicted ArsR family transcriptional regulator